LKGRYGARRAEVEAVVQRLYRADCVDHPILLCGIYSAALVNRRSRDADARLNGHADGGGCYPGRPDGHANAFAHPWNGHTDSDALGAADLYADIDPDADLHAVAYTNANRDPAPNGDPVADGDAGAGADADGYAFTLI